ncbi:glucosamine-6-phosphate deaminase [Dyadobacter sp. CY345]|uniref:glucosamine-6-phosphate deaminase n=1 Tax=Dyadobacter sp. CY345 TaxID=2909335 RepID=UPI001F288EFC|nr:glucosamine-6-phosphate deaminase [Dyadobacter sp. CY345]MCF2446270.1 glucosamine-6-phosphate deaminase [Dyadobacter sp. CY345]
MELKVYPSKDAMSKAAADLVVAQVQKKANSILCFPSGESPLIVLEYLVKYGKEKVVDFDRCHFVGLDEWIGMNENDEGSCKHFMYSKFFKLLNIREEQIVFFDGMAADLDEECQKMDAYIKDNGPIDLIMVGLGMNGHIGLNEPGTDFKLYAHQAELDPITVEVAQKYFQKSTELSGGITLGLQHLMEAKMAVLIVSGGKKSGILKEVLTNSVTNEIPGTIVQSHANAYVLVDEDAASKLDRSSSFF